MLDKRREFHVQVYAYKRSRKDTFCKKVLRVTRFNEGPVLFYSTIHCTAYENSPQVTCAQAWNALTSEIRNTETISEFKSLAKEILKDSIPKM